MAGIAGHLGDKSEYTQSFVEKMGSTAKPSDQNVDFGVRDTDLL